MDGWRTLELAIPRDDSNRVAYLMGVHGNTVRTWRREPESDEECGTGRRSPLDRICDLISAVYRSNPQGAELIVEHIRAYLVDLKTAHDRKPTEPQQLAEQVRQAMLLLTGVSDELRADRKNKLQVVK
jgi:hypothetical protein